MPRKLELLFEYADEESQLIEIDIYAPTAVTFAFLDEHIRQHDRPLRIWLDNSIQSRDQNLQDWATRNAVTMVRLRFGDSRMAAQFEWLHRKARTQRLVFKSSSV